MIGIDVSKDVLSCTLLDPTTRERLWHKEVKNTSAGWKQLLRHTPVACSWVIEPTGRYSQEVCVPRVLRGVMCAWRSPRKRSCF